MENIILIISTSLISGLLATIVTIIVQKNTKLRDAKMRIFETLMSLRYAMHLQESVSAFNKIIVVFYKNQKVIDAWKEFKKEAEYASADPSKANNLLDKQMKVLEEMAKCLGYKNINWEDIKNFYYPKGLSEKDNEEVLLRKLQLQNTTKPNIQPGNVQVPTTEQLGMTIAMKLLETPEGVDNLIKLSEKFSKKKES